METTRAGAVIDTPGRVVAQQHGRAHVGRWLQQGSGGGGGVRRRRAREAATEGVHGYRTMEVHGRAGVRLVRQASTGTGVCEEGVGEVCTHQKTRVSLLQRRAARAAAWRVGKAAGRRQHLVHAA